MISKTLPRSEIAGHPTIVAGQGRPVLLLHGVGLRAEAWQPQIEALCRTHRVIAPDMPGHGDTPCPDAPMAIEGYAQALLPVLETLAEPATLVGHSMGAMIGLDLANRAPDKVCAVAALNAVFERSSDAVKAVKSRAEALDGVTAPDPTQTLVRWFGTALSPERAACELWLRNVDPMGYKLAYSAFASAEIPNRQGLTTLHCPALFMTGASEPNSTPDMSRKMAELAPKGRSLIVEGAAHMMPMTHAEEVNAALMQLSDEVWS